MPTPDDDDDSACSPAIAAALDLIVKHRTLLSKAGRALEYHHSGIGSGTTWNKKSRSEHMELAIYDLQDLISGIEFKQLREAAKALAEYERAN